MRDRQPPSSERKRLTIGILSETAFFNTESFIFQGANAAAEQYDANLVFVLPLEDRREATHYGANQPGNFREAYDQLKAYLDIFELDGLIYIGWANIFQGESGRALSELLQPMRLLSISGNANGHPSVLMEGGPKIAELTRHLITEHGKRHIAYVCPWSDDDRMDSYAAVMREYRLYDERLIVPLRELQGVNNVVERMERAAGILLEERTGPIDAIVVLTAYEGFHMLEELKKRNLRVPEDIALVCYEDHPIIAFSEPPLTTIDYPYYDLGFAACEQLVRELDGNGIPKSTTLSGKILYRDSCGCTVKEVRPIRHAAESELQSPTADEKPLSIERIAAGLQDAFPDTGLDFDVLAERFLHSLERGDGAFLEAFSRQVNGLRNRKKEMLGDVLDAFRLKLLAYVRGNRELYERAEGIWYGARYVVRQYETEGHLDDYMYKHEISYRLNYVNRHLLAIRSVAELPDVLANNIGWLNIPTCFLMLDDEETAAPHDSRLVFSFDNYEEQSAVYPAGMNLHRAFHAFKAHRGGRFSLMVMPLQAGDKRIGYVWADPGPNHCSLLVTLLDVTSQAIIGAKRQEELRDVVQRLSEEIEIRRQKEAQLAYYANVDSLTGLFNRRYFYDALSDIRSKETAFAVLFIDIDGFKSINDTYGHDTGDLFLRQIADRLRALLEPYTYGIAHTHADATNGHIHSIFRIGGDEFTALLRVAAKDELALLAERLCDEIRRPFDLNGNLARVSGSIGIAVYPKDAAGTEQLLKFADLALYKAKETKNQYIFYEDVNE